MCGACGSGVVRAPWEVALAGGAPADLRRRADIAAALTEDGSASARGDRRASCCTRTAPVQAVASLEPLATALHRHLRPGLPGCRGCGHAGTGFTIALPDGYDVQRLAVWVALARGTRPRTSNIHVETHAGLARGGADRTARRRARRWSRVVPAHRAHRGPGGRPRTRVRAAVALN